MSCDSITCLTASCIHRCAVDSTAKITETGLPYYVVGHKNGPTMICAQANEASDSPLCHVIFTYVVHARVSWQAYTVYDF
jgi:hypothetical protein